MSIGEISVVVLIMAVAGGLVVILANDPCGLPTSSTDPYRGQPEDTAIENNCMDIAYGDEPRVSISGDTTILTMDLNSDLYSTAQANLFLTRALERCSCEHLTTYARADGGLTFVARYEDGTPLRLELIRL